jgi:hypothetical protein
MKALREASAAALEMPPFSASLATKSAFVMNGSFLRSAE